MRRRTPLIATGALVLAGVAAGTGISLAAGGDDDATERPITGPALEQARATALAHTEGGRVTGTEAGDDDSHYEVEVTLDDGRQVDVQLDRAFHVVASTEDRDEGDAADD